MKELIEQRAHTIALEIIAEKLSGLTIAEAKWVLRETAVYLDSTHSVDVTTVSFAAAVEECRAASVSED